MIVKFESMITGFIKILIEIPILLFTENNEEQLIEFININKTK